MADATNPTAESPWFAAVRPPVQRVLEGIFMSFARPLTVRDHGRPYLVVAPHPDDESLGCGALIARACRLGIPVHVAVVTDGGRHPSGGGDDDVPGLRRRETLSACAGLGVPPSHVTFLGYPDGAAAAHVEGIASGLLALVAGLAPERVFVPSELDNHADHRAVAAACRRLQREGSPWTTIYAYPIWFWFPRFLLEAFGRGHHRRLVGLPTEEFLAAKRSALRAYASQTRAEGAAGLIEAQFRRQCRMRSEYFFEVTAP